MKFRLVESTKTLDGFIMFDSLEEINKALDNFEVAQGKEFKYAFSFDGNAYKVSLIWDLNGEPEGIFQSSNKPNPNLFHKNVTDTDNIESAKRIIENLKDSLSYVYERDNNGFTY